MTSQRAILFAVVILVMGSLVACTRSIAGSSRTTTGTPAAPQALEGTDVMGQIYIFATQTALAATGVPSEEPYPTEGEGEVLPTEILEATAIPITEETTPLPPAGTTPPAAGAPATAQPPLGTVPPLVVPDTYKLQKGEFPFCIARRFNVDPAELLRINGLTGKAVYYTGMVLRIPKSGRGFPGKRALLPHPTTYTVRPGDTIYTIACAFGDVDPNAIIAVNNLKPPYRLTPGQVLHIP